MKAFDRNDYRRFDHVGSDSAEENYPVDSIEEIVRKAAHLQGLPAPDSASMSWNAGGHVSDRVKTHPADRSCPAWVYSDPDTWVAPPDPCEPKLVQQLVVATNSLTQANIPGTGKKHTWGTCAAAEAEADSSQVRQSTNSDI